MYFVKSLTMIEGYHRWPNAPSNVGYLANKHRHIFYIRTTFNVSHSDRELEVNLIQQDVKQHLECEFGSPCMFGDMSCEDIAKFVCDRFPGFVKECEVLEDNLSGGGYISEE